VPWSIQRRIPPAACAPEICTLEVCRTVLTTGTLRVSRAGELESLDLHEHGMLAYPEYVIHGYEPALHLVTKPASEVAMAPVTQPAQ